MSFLPQLVFLIILVATGFILYKRVSFLRKSILLGKPETRNDRRSERWKTMWLVAFGQKKMFKRVTPAILHLFIYASFIIINIEVLEFVIDGLTGGHRTFAPYSGWLYPLAMNLVEFLALLVLIACVAFLVRRNITKVPRLNARELKGWPALDANLILIIEIVLMCAILTMNATDQILAERATPSYITIDHLFLSGLIIPLFDGLSTGSLIVVERSAWWFHIIGILGFAIYVTYSKHLHIFL